MPYLCTVLRVCFFEILEYIRFGLFTHQRTDFLTMTEYVVHILNEFKFIRVAVFFQRCLNSLQDSIGSFDQAHAGCQET